MLRGRARLPQDPSTVVTFISYSQNLEDVLLWRALRGVKSGFYIDIGAWDPTIDSLTRAFYERGWRGINVEPNGDKFAALVAARPEDVNLQCAVSDHAGSQIFYDVPETGLSTLDAHLAQRHRADGRTVIETSVEVTTLAALCAAHVTGVTHFLKIDVEGLERAVLAGADFNRFRPWIVVVEATEPNSPAPSHAAWEPLLLAAQYVLVYFDGLNRYYVADEHRAALAPAFAAPPNVFDDYLSDAGVRKALLLQGLGVAVPVLDDIADCQRRADADAAAAHEALSVRAATLDTALQARNSELQDALAAHKRAEADALAARMEMALVRADAVQTSAGPPLQPHAAARPMVVESVAGEVTTPLFYDASLILHFGLETAVGLIRTEHYVAEFLARAPAVDLHFIRFDSEVLAFRALSAGEQALLNTILFHRYDDVAQEAGAQEAGAPEAGAPGLAENEPLLDLEHHRHVEPAAEGTASVWREWLSLPALLRRASTVATLTPQAYDEMLVHYARRFLPVRDDYSPLRRLAVRAARVASLRAMWTGRTVLVPVVRTARAVRRSANRALRPDPAGLNLEAPIAGAASPASPLRPPAIEFPPGAVLLSLGNSWDYLDYEYLARICEEGVRFISVIYDVIAMELPFSTPGPPNLYHRHWVEIGHCADALLAISKFSADQYQDLIARPNGLTPRLSHAYLPSFLRERAAEIGETPVVSLIGHRFVVFCSTIETRKNHQLLLQLWDRLRVVVSPADLPILVFAGKWGWGTETVRLLSERNYRLRSHLKILNTVTDAELIWLYRHARFTVLPALSEGYGLAAAESLSFGTPVVIAHCPALVEATENLMPALDPLDFVAWFDLMRRLIEDDAHLDKLREAAKRYRGPAYADFAQAICDLTRAGPPPGTPPGPLMTTEDR